MVVGPAAKLDAAARDTAKPRAGLNKRLSKDDVPFTGKDTFDERMTKLLE
jgi:hypothetical protein